MTLALVIRRLLLLLPLLALLLAPSSARAEDPVDGPGDDGQVTASFGIPSGDPGETVTIELVARRGTELAPGLDVVFTWRSQGVEPPEGTATTVTDEAGVARVDVVLGYWTQVTGTVLDEDGTTLATTTAVAQPILCRCSPVYVVADLVGIAARNGDDRVVLRAGELAAGARAELYRIDASGTAHRIRRSTLGSTGKRAWRVQDHNGRGMTRYYAKIGATETSAAAVSRTVRIR